MPEARGHLRLDRECTIVRPPASSHATSPQSKADLSMLYRRSAEEATLEASEAEVVRLNQVIKQLEARIVKLEAGQQQHPVPTPTPAATTTPSVAPAAPLTIASPDPSLAASALDNFSIASPRGEPLRPSTASSRASSFEPLEQQQQQQATPMAYAAAAPYPPSAAASYLVSAPSSTSAAGRYASTAPQPQPRGGQPTASLYSVDSYGAAPSLSPSSSVTSFASSFQTMEHHPDPRFLYNGPPAPSSSSYAAPPQPHIYQHHQGYPAVVEQRHWSQELQQVKVEHHQHQQQGQWAAPPPQQFADVHGRVVYQHQQQQQQRWHS